MESLLRHWRPTVLLLKMSLFTSADTFISRMRWVFTSRVLSFTSSTGLMELHRSLLSSSGDPAEPSWRSAASPRSHVALGHVDADVGVRELYGAPELSSLHTMFVSTAWVWPHPGLWPSRSRSWQDRASFRWLSQAARKSSRLWNCSGAGDFKPVKNPEDAGASDLAWSTESSERL